MRHPNIVEFIGAIREPEKLCIVTEFAGKILFDTHPDLWLIDLCFFFDSHAFLAQSTAVFSRV